MTDNLEMSFEQDVTAKLHDLRVNREAKRREGAGLWTPPPYPTTAFDQLAEEPPTVDWIFRDLWAGNAQINAQKKSGKTTLLLNAAAALLTSDPFLGRFEVHAESDCRIAFLNMELTRGQFNRWIDDMALPDDALKRLSIHHAREAGRLDLANDAVAEWVVQWLRETGVSVLLMDPLGSFFDQPSGGDPNAAYLQWWSSFERVVREAELRGVLIAHHAGYSEEGGNRARGASAMMDKPDVNISYRYETGDGGHTDAPIDSKRYLRAYGRDVDVPEFEMDYDMRTRRLVVTGGGSRAENAPERFALRAYDAMAAYAYQQRERGVEGDIEIAADDLLAQARIKPTGKTSGDFRQGRSLAVARNWLRERKEGNSKKYSLGEIVPPPRRKTKLDNVVNPN